MNREDAMPRPKAPPEKPRLTHLMVGGAVPLEGVGFVLAALYEQGALHFEHQPFILQPSQAQAATPGLAHDDPLQLPPPKRPPMDEVIARVAAYAKGKPITWAKIKAAIVEAGFAQASTSTAIERAIERNLIKKVDGGYLRVKGTKVAKEPKPNGKRKSPTPHKKAPGGLNLRDYMIKILKAAYPGFMPRKALIEKFNKAGLRGESCSVPLTYLKRDGLVETGETPGTYRWVPDNQRNNTTAGAKPQ